MVRGSCLEYGHCGLIVIVFFFPLSVAQSLIGNGFTSFATSFLDRPLPTGSKVELVRDCLPQGG